MRLNIRTVQIHSATHSHLSADHPYPLPGTAFKPSLLDWLRILPASLVLHPEHQKPHSPWRFTRRMVAQLILFVVSLHPGLDWIAHRKFLCALSLSHSSDRLPFPASMRTHDRSEESPFMVIPAKHHHTNTIYGHPYLLPRNWLSNSLRLLKPKPFSVSSSPASLVATAHSPNPSDIHPRRRTLQCSLASSQTPSGGSKAQPRRLMPFPHPLHPPKSMSSRPKSKP